MRMDELYLYEDFLPGAAAGRFTGLGGSRIFVQAGVTAEEAQAFADRLCAAGFAPLQQREQNGMRYAALQKEPYAAHLLYSPREKELRVCLAAQENVPRLTPDGCKGDGNTVFYAFENDQTLIDCGMCLMIKCPDHSFFMVDSGHYFQPNDNDRIYRFLRERTPKGQKVRVCGWLITHAHTDHVCKLMDFLKYNTDDVEIEGFYLNLLPPDYAVWDDNHEEAHIAAKLLEALAACPAPAYTLHTGMRFFVRSLAFDVLSTHEDLHPDFIEDYNDTSAVVMLHAEGSRVLIPGDAAVAAGKKMELRWGHTLKSDVVQVSHHGHTGLSPRCYELIGADTAIFPVTRIMFEQELPKKEANRRLIDLASQYFITGDGTVCVPLPYKKEAVYTLPDETVEDFAKIRRLWKYDYTPEYKDYIWRAFLAHGGDPAKLQLPTAPEGWIEPK